MSEKQGKESQDLYQHYEFKVDPKQTPIRLDKFLMDRIEKITRNKLQNAIKDGLVKVNGNTVKPNYKVTPLDEITVFYDQKPKWGTEIEGEDIPLDVVYEDTDILIINKPAGMVVHPGIGNRDGTLVHALVNYFKQKDLPVMDGNDPDRPGLVHRIDKDTSGLLVIAKNELAMTGLSKQFKAHDIDRTYQALVWGEPEEPEGTIQSYIGRHAKHRLQFTTYDHEDQGKWAVTHYKTIDPMYYVSLVECKLETGRTHQIRVHMKSIGHTLFNDSRYGGDKILKGTVFNKYKQFVHNCFDLLPRQGLHAASLGFIHPRSGEKMYFELPLAEDIQKAVDKWKHYIEHRKIKD